MKKYIFAALSFVVAMTATSCSEEQGQMPGNDKNPAVTVYLYDTPAEYDGDCDVYFGLFSNDKATEVYYLAEKTSDMESKVGSMGEEGYVDYIIQNGTKVSAKADSPEYVVMKNVFGANTISAVAVGGSKKSAKAHSIQFTGLQWNTVCAGTYTRPAGKGYTGVLGEEQETELQVLSTNPSSYRFKNLYGPNKHMYFTYTGEAYDEDGGVFCRVSAQSTEHTYGSYGTMSVRDVATWQGDDGYLDVALYPDGYWFGWVQYYVSAGSLGYGYDEFYPAE